MCVGNISGKYMSESASTATTEEFSEGGDVVRDVCHQTTGA